MELSSYILQIANKDTDALYKLYELINKNVYSFALSILRNHDDALEVMQDTFVSVYNNANRYENKDKPMAWILRLPKIYLIWN